MLEHLAKHLKGKVIILGVGNVLCSDDAVGSLLAQRMIGKLPFIVWDVGISPENYLGKIIKEKPDNLVIVDAADFGAKPGDFKVIESDDFKTTNLFATHNASLSLTINYLKSNIKTDIIILAIQPKTAVFGEILSPEVQSALHQLENWFYDAAKEKR